jgi:uncharacterized membrane protein
MLKLAPLGRLFFAVAMLAFGIQQVVYLDFVTRAIPQLPASIGWHQVLACVSGAFFFAAGLAIITGRGARLAALALGAVILVAFLLLYLPQLITTTPNGGLWTSAGKGLALSGGAFIVAASLPPQRLHRLATLGILFFAAFLILCGIEHFIYVPFVASLVPSWIPGHVFWTWFAGLALIAGGLGIIVRKTRRAAALLTGVMIFLWLVMLHIPRALTDLHNANETTAVFEALAFAGVSFLIAISGRRA